jgi:hypothetical protein
VALARAPACNHTICTAPDDEIDLGLKTTLDQFAVFVKRHGERRQYACEVLTREGKRTSQGKLHV